MKKTISLFWPVYNGREVQQAMKKLFPINMSNRWLGQGPKVDEFEKKFGEKFNYKYCVAVNSGSAALELAYHLVGLQRGDKVVTPVLTCTATNLPLLRIGVEPIFADIKEEDWTINPVDVENKLNVMSDIKAVVAVTLGGLPVDKQIFGLAKKHQLPVVIDACQSVGVRESQGDYIAYSFQAIKHFTTGDGGMLVVRNKEDYERAKRLRWFGIDREKKMKAGWQPYQRREMTMDIEEPGYKFQMNDIIATLGILGLKHTDKYMKQRQKIVAYYNKHLKCPTVGGGACWLYGILVNNRDYVAAKLKEAGIETNMAHLRNDIFAVFGGKRQDLPIMNEIEDQYLYIPLNNKMTMKDAEYVVGKFNVLNTG